MMFSSIRFTKCRSHYLLHLLIAIFCTFTELAKAQQEPLNTMYMFNSISINSAYAGSRDGLNAVLLHRRQWINIEGAPTTTTFSLHSPVKKSRVALGLSVVAHDVGPVNNTFSNIYYAYHLPISERTTLSFGVNAGVYTYNPNFLSLDAYDPTDITYNSDENKVSPNGGFGAYLYSFNYYVSFSMPKVFQTDFDKDRDDMSELRRHAYITAGYVFTLGQDWALKPSMFTKLVQGSPGSYDVTLQLFYKDIINVGISYRFEDATAFILGLNITRDLMIGYSYDLTISDLNYVSNGSHEFMISYDLDRIKRSRVKSPRYF